MGRSSRQYVRDDVFKKARAVCLANVWQDASVRRVAPPGLVGVRREATGELPRFAYDSSEANGLKPSSRLGKPRPSPVGSQMRRIALCTDLEIVR